MEYVKESHVYRLLGQSVVGFRGSLKLGSVIEKEHEALLNGSTRYEWSLMDEDHRYCDQSFVAKVTRSSSLEGVATAAKRLSIECQRELSFEFKMENLDLLDYFLGLEVWRRSNEKIVDIMMDTSLVKREGGWSFLRHDMGQKFSQIGHVT